MKAQLQTVLNDISSNQNPTRADLINQAIEHQEAFVTPAGALATWHATDSTGRSPQNTFIVKQAPSEQNIDWSFSINNPLEPAVFDELFAAATQTLKNESNVIVLDRQIGAEVETALPVRVVTNQALTALFADNMFRELKKSADFSDDETFTLLSLPKNRIPAQFQRQDNMIVAMDLDRKIGLIWGCEYLGALKKLMFTVMNYLLPEQGILPLHCAANEDGDHTSTLILGLSGTGKTTLSADPARALVGDDEHGWSDTGIFNFEGGCYAKLIDLSAEKEPEIHRITFGETLPPAENGVIIENALMYPNGTFDLSDTRLTANSRVSYPINRLSNFQPTGQSGHPSTILFLTADANGVLPPVAKLNTEQAMLWFLMGYTSKLAGTETGVKEPVSTFSRFFGGPFMPRNPQDYANLLRKKIEQHDVQVFLINTGWTGGPYGTGQRINLPTTRAIVDAAINGDLNQVDYSENDLFHFAVPTTCPGVETQLLDPKNTWTDPQAYDQRAQKLAQEFSTFFAEQFPNIDSNIAQMCPGK